MQMASTSGNNYKKHQLINERLKSHMGATWLKRLNDPYSAAIPAVTIITVETRLSSKTVQID